MSYFKFIYDSLSDSWEIQSNQSFPTRQKAKEYLDNFYAVKNERDKLKDKLKRIQDECDVIRCTGIPCVTSPETSIMHKELNAQMILVRKIEEIINESL